MNLKWTQLWIIENEFFLIIRFGNRNFLSLHNNGITHQLIITFTIILVAVLSLLAPKTVQPTATYISITLSLSLILYLIIKIIHSILKKKFSAPVIEIDNSSQNVGYSSFVNTSSRRSSIFTLQTQNNNQAFGSQITLQSELPPSYEQPPSYSSLWTLKWSLFMPLF
jgi:hypothetical protein